MKNPKRPPRHPMDKGKHYPRPDRMVRKTGNMLEGIADTVEQIDDEMLGTLDAEARSLAADQISKSITKLIAFEKRLGGDSQPRVKANTPPLGKLHRMEDVWRGLHIDYGATSSGARDELQHGLRWAERLGRPRRGEREEERIAHYSNVYDIAKSPRGREEAVESLAKEIDKPKETASRYIRLYRQNRK